MHQIQLFVRQRGRRPYLLRHRRLLLALVLGLGYLIDAGIAAAADATADQVQLRVFPAAQIFTFLFLMLGPFKIIGPFSQMTKGADAALTRQIALRATFFASIGLLLAAFLGESILSNYGIPLPILALSAGIILLLVALQSTLQQFIPPAPHGEGAAAPAPTLKMALMPLAFPTIVTPYGIAALVVFLALSPDLRGRLVIGGVLLAIMLLNLTVSLLVKHIGPVLGVFLQILGAVLGVIQVALGLQIIHNSLKALGAL